MARGGFESLLTVLFHYLGAQHAFSGAQSVIVNHTLIFKSTKNRESSDKEVDEKEKMRRR